MGFYCRLVERRIRLREKVKCIACVLRGFLFSILLSCGGLTLGRTRNGLNGLEGYRGFFGEKEVERG